LQLQLVVKAILSTWTKPQLKGTGCIKLTFQGLSHLKRINGNLDTRFGNF